MVKEKPVGQRIFLPRPTLILGCGISGSGKTIVLNEVTRRVIDSFWIDKDTLNESFMYDKDERIIPGGITSDHYHNHVKNQSYKYMINEALINIRLGKNPIIEGNYNKQIRTGYLDKVIFPLFAQENCSIKIVYCYAHEQVIHNRIVSRAAPRDEEKYRNPESWEEFLKNQPILPSELENYNHIKVDTNQPVDKCAIDVIEYLLQ